VARAARELQGSSACSVESTEWSLSDGLLYFWGKIYVPDPSDLHRRIVALSHDSRLAGHSGRWKTLKLVSWNFIMHHCPGKSMGKTDALSCRSDHGIGSEDNDNMVLLTPNFFAV